MACEQHGLDADLIISLLNKAVVSIESEKMPSQNQPIPLSAIQGKLKEGDVINQQHILGDILKVYPATEKVFRKYYGAACFSCPGQATETVRQSAMMHNADEKKVLAELNEAVEG
jgi:hybrid cluster-associated redox disulfide protein